MNSTPTPDLRQLAQEIADALGSPWTKSVAQRSGTSGVVNNPPKGLNLQTLVFHPARPKRLPVAVIPDFWQIGVYNMSNGFR